MADPRNDFRHTEPGDDHRRVFLGGWTDAVNGTLYVSDTDNSRVVRIPDSFCRMPP